ncbi:FAD:protein FMN transferase [candidate division KSB1 bacterium]|nr:FAD:protein FMN transferase [candidate division KSB1 bacterium]RQW02204.1 MAG: FAD:protein FMN transferase [candidate division KSB1 bacterium]
MRTKLFFLLLLLASLLWIWLRSQTDLEQYTLNGATMGTSYNVKIVEPVTHIIDQTALHNDIDSLLYDINHIMSTYIENSEISLFNKAPAHEWISISQNLCDIFNVAIETSRKSSGAFDITVGPLVNLWGFGPEHNASDLPSEVDIQARKNRTGFQHLKIQNQPPAALKSIDSMYCDLSAIAKGWGVDRVAEFLESKGYHNYLVEIGGEIRAKGVNVHKGPWRIGVSSPNELSGIQKVIEVLDVGIATSGDYRNYFEMGGVRYSHTIDPRTGRPITHNVASVTVIYTSCMMADAYATAINVLGLEQGMMLAEKENLPVLMIVKTENGFVEKKTPSFEAYISK